MIVCYVQHSVIPMKLILQPLKELFAASTNTSDVTDLVLPFSVCVLALSADIVFRKIKESIICRYKRNMV